MDCVIRRLTRTHSTRSRTSANALIWHLCVHVHMPTPLNELQQNCSQPLPLPPPLHDHPRPLLFGLKSWWLTGWCGVTGAHVATTPNGAGTGDATALRYTHQHTHTDTHLVINMETVGREAKTMLDSAGGCWFPLWFEKGVPHHSNIWYSLIPLTIV